MNLYDLVLRRDRMVASLDPRIRAGVRKEKAGTQRSVTMPAGSALMLLGAHRVTALRGFPACPGWICHLGEGAYFEIELLGVEGPHVLARMEAPRASAAPPAHRRWWSMGRHAAVMPEPAPVANGAVEVRLAWPMPVPPEFDLRFSAHGEAVDLSVGPLFDPRARLLPLLRGHGVEVGPGARPSVLPDSTRQVTYVEKLTREQWARTYPKTSLTPEQSQLWDRYVVDSARTLERFGDGSLGYVFSSHVLEHLVDPIGVLRAWWARLAPGGVIAGVVPDARYTFDLRQPLTSLDALEAQYRERLEDPTDAMYERWCRDTAPEATPDSLRARDYAIHVNYFCPEVFRELLDRVAEGEGGHAGVFIETVRNGKDFGFAVFKP